MNTEYNKAFLYLYFSRVQKICVPTIGDTSAGRVLGWGHAFLFYVFVKVRVK